MPHPKEDDDDVLAALMAKETDGEPDGDEAMAADKPAAAGDPMQLLSSIRMKLDELESKLAG